MTAVIDTRLLITIEFPPTEEIRASSADLFQRESARGLITPSIVLTEFVKIAGAQMGEGAARTRVRLFKDRGMRIASVEEKEAIVAGQILLSHRNVPIADAIIASFVKNGAAEYVVSDDLHYPLLKDKVALN